MTEFDLPRIHYRQRPDFPLDSAESRPSGRSIGATDKMKNNPASARYGLLAGGNWIIDQVKLLDVYPQPEQLANIRSQAQGSGGAPYNVLVNLARLGIPFPLFAAGLVGRDALGQLILEDC